MKLRAQGHKREFKPCHLYISFKNESSSFEIKFKNGYLYVNLVVMVTNSLSRYRKYINISGTHTYSIKIIK